MVDIWVLEDTFGVAPYFYFYDDGRAANALASHAYIPGKDPYLGSPGRFRVDRTPRKSDGCVLLGSALVQTLARRGEGGRDAVRCVLAHEYGHILQFRRGTSLGTVTRRELHADYLAGWAFRRIASRRDEAHARYFGAKTSAERTKIYSDLYVVVSPGGYDEANVIGEIYRLGDSAFSDPDHHGTRKERLSAFMAGFACRKADAPGAFAEGEAFVSAMKLEAEKQPAGDGPAPAGPRGK